MSRNRHSQIILSALAFLGTLFGYGCNSSFTVEPTPTLRNVIGGVGSTFVDPLMKRWIMGFQQTHPQIGVNYRAEGSGAGIAEIKQSMTEFAASDAPLGDDELKNMPPILQMPVTAGPVCVIYNLPQLKSALRLDGKTLADIYIGKVVTWNDPAIAHDNPGVNLPKATIIVVHRADSSGTTSIFTTYLSKVSLDWSKKPGAGLTVAGGSRRKGQHGNH